MALFRRKDAARIYAIKLYCLGEPSDREVLVSQILLSLHDVFGAYPVEYDIGGPYGIRKGSAVGLKSFQDRLDRTGHAKYFSLSGETSQHFGFQLLLGTPSDDASYSELILWYAPERYQVDFLRLVEPLLAPLNATCGFEVDLPINYSVRTETRVKRGLFGSITVEVNNKHLAWVPSIREGGVRGLFRNNIVNGEQLARLSMAEGTVIEEVGIGLYYVRPPQ